MLLDHLMIFNLTVCLGIYVVIFVGTLILQKRELSKHQEKAMRYAALPIRFKLACWLIVLPLFTLATFSLFYLGSGMEFLFVVGLIAYLILEIKVVSWYKDNGLLDVE